MRNRLRTLIILLTAYCVAPCFSGIGLLQNNIGCNLNKVGLRSKNIGTCFFHFGTLQAKVKTKVTDFGRLSTGEATHLFTFRNKRGESLSVTDYGARIVSIVVKDRKGKRGDVVVGPGDIRTFETGDRFVGCTLGRYGNRIDHSSFMLDGKHYNLDANEVFDGEKVHLSGGPKGVDRFVWKSTSVSRSDAAGVRFERLDPDGLNGYPGNANLSVTFWWTDDSRCRIEYEATTDKPTIVNLSNHAYFNLKGDEGGYVMDHLLQVDADTCIQNNRHLCPDLLLNVEGTPFDFRTPHRVDYRLDMPSKHLEIMHGMSACWILRNYDDRHKSLRRAGDLYDRRSGRGVETWTTEPCLLTYTGRGFDGTLKGKYGPIEKYGGMLLETLHAADSPNQPRFPSTVLRPGEKYTSVTEFRFYAK